MSAAVRKDCIISDRTCLIGLERINRLDIPPRLYGRVWIPPAVDQEIGFSMPWLEVQPVTNQALVSSLRTQIDWGESEAIALALEIKGTPILLDDKKARRIAAQFDLPITGTVGLLLKAKRENVIDALCPILDALEMAEFRIAPALRRRALELADEA